MADRIQQRRDTAANWTATNPVLAQGEFGIETDTLKIKCGNGSSAWSALGYLINTGAYLTTETDPVFVAHPAYGINGTNITNWDTAYGWGNHASAGYLTTSTASSTYAPLASPTFTGTTSLAIARPTVLRETRVAMPANNVDMATGNYFTKTVSGTTTFTVSNVASAGVVSAFVLDLTNGGSATVNWFSGVKWAGGAAPTLTASGRDVLAFFTHDAGTTWNGFVLGLDVK